MTARQRLFDIIEKSNGTNKTSKIFDIIIMSLIVLNIISIVLESHDWIYVQYEKEFILFEKISVLIFTFEYISRIITAKYKYPSKSKLAAPFAFIFSFYGIIDLLAILPSYLFLLHLDLRFIRIFRLFRLFRLFKFGRYNNALGILINVVKARREELLLTLFMTFILLLFSACLIFIVEHEAQPAIFSSITKSIWWAVATLTTVGYGDMYPITPIGNVIASFVAIMGIGLVALPTGIIGTGFIEEVSKNNKEERCTCPKCGNVF
ncbi:ion transporter [Flammeovirga yaeyamensis]|uniref:Ion transporter n=1 Tax=Flammeovirga yaeyamensis TaxID=367791 RepID=A0AAX1N498_9BACT|nr:ion transporter [Flammeovirga yaeyamensis]MBB3699753.1 voltage-gated potassium channel [Flammeovirga yaeyamensis]NMF36678.1 ion transporter [Flammeovirga yaeyamensis]QWG02277.1 ion transporter [Flammeovirga yaeyamensis]